jgi:hypothetical protein
MGLSRLSNGERIMAVSAILLFVFMFFDWFGLKDAGELRLFSVGHNAWEALDYIPIILGITIFAALRVVALRVTAIRKPPVPANMLVAILGTLSTMLIVYRIADPPNFGSFQEAWGTITIEGTVQFPIFLALLAAAGIAVGGFLAMRGEGGFPAGLRTTVRRQN